MPRAFADRRKERHEQAPLYSPQHFPVVSRYLSNLQALAVEPPRFNGHASPQAGKLILHSSDVLCWLKTPVILSTCHAGNTTTVSDPDVCVFRSSTTPSRTRTAA